MIKIISSDVSNYQHWNGPNSNWENISVSHDKTYYDSHTGNVHVSYKFVFKRRSQYFLLNLFGPVILLTLLQLFGFLISPDTVDRTMYSATIMLAMFVLHDQILSYLPQTPQPIVVAYYVMIVMGFGTYCTFYDALLFWLISNSRIFHKSVSRRKFKLYNVIDAICFVFMLAFVSVANIICLQRTGSK